jgi:hypothetical protein
MPNGTTKMPKIVDFMLYQLYNHPDILKFMVHWVKQTTFRHHIHALHLHTVHKEFGLSINSQNPPATLYPQLDFTILLAGSRIWVFYPNAISG